MHDWGPSERVTRGWYGPGWERPHLHSPTCNCIWILGQRKGWRGIDISWVRGGWGYNTVDINLVLMCKPKFLVQCPLLTVNFRHFKVMGSFQHCRGPWWPGVGCTATTVVRSSQKEVCTHIYTNIYIYKYLWMHTAGVPAKLEEPCSFMRDQASVKKEGRKWQKRQHHNTFCLSWDSEKLKAQKTNTLFP